MTVLWIDVSQHDRNRRGAPLDWAAIKSATSPVMFARATYGDPGGLHYATAYFDEHIKGAAAGGFVVRGAYHNLISGDAACIARQIDWLRRTRDAAGANSAMMDCEPYQELVTNGRWPRYEDIMRARDRWMALEPDPPAWYIPRWFWERSVAQIGLGARSLTGLPGMLIQSHYAGGDGTAAAIYKAAGGDAGTGWDDAFGARLPDGWQFTSSADVPGATNATDVNAFRGTLAQLVAALTGGDNVTQDEINAVANAVWNHSIAQYLRFWGDAVVNQRDTFQAGAPDRIVGQPVPLTARLGRLETAVAAPTVATLDDTQLAALADKVSAAVVAAPDNPLTQADLDAVRAQVKQALREGVGTA